ncbi:PASTA domain-containing protein [Myxococcota bacterium]|nr:PASTA domain-containing protein [Myxococcota bacterium]
MSPKTPRQGLGRLLGSLSVIERARREAKRDKVRARRGGRREGGLVQEVPSQKPRNRRDDDEPVHGGIRIGVVAFVLAAAAIAILVRAGQLQLVQGQELEEVSRRQAEVSALISAKRGVIKDRNGAELAISVDVDTVTAQPKRMSPEERSETARVLAPVLSMSVKELEARLDPSKGFVYLKRWVDRAAGAKVKELITPPKKGDDRPYLAHVGLMQEPRRFYSNRGLAAHSVGFLTSDGRGAAGIERRYDEDLRGRTDEVSGLRDALGQKVFVEGFTPHAELEGADVTLTIDRQIQHAAEEALRGAVAEHRARGGVAIVLESKTGDVLALASYPTYDPNDLRKTSSDQQMNRAISAVYDPGSTVKMVTLSAALDAGVVRPDTLVDCQNGLMRVGRRTIKDSHGGTKVVTVTEVMKVSSNVGTAKVGMKLGKEKLHAALKAFGLGDRTGIELPGEVRGIVRPHERWREIEFANIAFGQGVSATPLQIATAASVFANGGQRIAPRIVREVVDKSGHRSAPPRPEPVQVLSEKTVRDVVPMLEEVTKKGGTAEGAAIPGFRVAGKTGTAQKIDPVTKAYSRELYVSSFVGFVPADRPEVTILVMIDEPKGGYYASKVAVPAWRQIALAALSAREVFPEDDAAREAFLAQYREAAEAQVAAEEARRVAEAELASMPHGPLAEAADGAAARGELAQDPELAEESDHEADLGPALVDGLEAALVADGAELAGVGGDGAERDGDDADAPTPGVDAEVRMPNFAGLELHEVLNRSAEVHCDPVLSGTGRVVAQSPRAGEVLPRGARCELKLEPNG